MNTSHATLKLGFIGGAIDSAVGHTHQIACEMDRRWSLDSGCFSSLPESNALTARLWGVSDDRLYSDWREFLERERSGLDAVCVLTPTPSHAEIVITALQMGWPVICEKALATSSREIEQIATAYRAKPAFLAVIYNYTGYPMLRELQYMIQQGKLGQIRQIHVEMPQEGFLRLNSCGEKPLPQTWRLRDDGVPTIYLDLAVHMHHIVRFLTGASPMQTAAVNNTYGFFGDIVDNTIALIRYTGNIDCNMWFSKSALGHSNGLRVRVYGSEAGAEWFQQDSEAILLSDQYGRRQRIERSSVDLRHANLKRYERFKSGHPAGFIEAFANYYDDLADAVLAYLQYGKHESPFVFGIDDAYEGVVLLEAMHASAISRSWMPVSVGKGLL